MTNRTYRVPTPKGETPLSLVLGGVAAVALFVVMALAQMMGEVEPPADELDEVVMAYVPPDVVELEEEEPPPPEEEEPTPELEEAPPQLSLDQLDIALNPGTGGSLAGDFALPTIGTSASDLGTEDFVDFSDLDQIPRPIGVSGFNFPSRLRKKKVSGRIVLLLKLDEKGRVLEVDVDSSNLPAFDDFVLDQVKRWRFTPPTQQGRPVKAKARLPIPINIT
jgi:protein TonB